MTNKPKDWAAGIPGVYHAMKQSVDQMGPKRTALTLLNLNQPDGFDCPGCAWPEPGKTHTAEFCENGAKAVAEEATTDRVTPEFFRQHSVEQLTRETDFWLGQQGRLTHPMVLREGGTHYEEISWDEAFDLISECLRGLDSPDAAAFYTSGRTSNEAAFLYQLFVREFGTNNLPDCSNMCHESSGSALGETIGVGKGTVTLDDIETSDLILINGQNPATNHPRMLSALEKTKANGGRIIAVNPLIEAGLVRFKNPQKPKGMLGKGIDIADEYCQIRLGGDLAFFQAIGKLLVESGDIDTDFIAEHTSGFQTYAAHLESLDWAPLLTATGLPREQLDRVADEVRRADSVISCWAMGLTQHKHSVPMIREAINFLLLRGNIGRPGAGACPVRGHSNVQGDRTMGIYEKPPADFLDALDTEFDITSPREHGHDVVDTIRAMRDGTVKFFMGMGGNFVRATPDTEVTEAALRNCELTVHVSTKLNGSHAITGRQALILPTMGRTEKDETGGMAQFVTVEDSMSMVHASRGRLKPASEHLLSEPAIVAHLAQRVLPDSQVAWSDLGGDYRKIRDRISRVVPGFTDFEAKVAQPGGFALPNGPRDSRTFDTSDGKAQFTVNEAAPPELEPGELLLQTVRSHDQYNTTIYGLDDRYRGIDNERRVVFVNAEDLASRGLEPDQLVDIVSIWRTASGEIEERRAKWFRLVDYPTARDCAAAYFPETNVLVPLDSTADVSNTPTSKSVVVRLEAAN